MPQQSCARGIEGGANLGHQQRVRNIQIRKLAQHLMNGGQRAQRLIYLGNIFHSSSRLGLRPYSQSSKDSA